MKIDKLKYKWWAKLLAAILLFAAGFGCLVGLIGIYACNSYDVYNTPKDEVQKELDIEMLDKYAVTAIASYVGGIAEATLSPNYRYDIFEGSTDGEKIGGNMTVEDAKDVVVHEFIITAYTTYKLADSMFQSAYVEGDFFDPGFEDYVNKFYYCLSSYTDADSNAGTFTGLAIDDLYIMGQNSGENIIYRVNPDLYRLDNDTGMVWLTTFSQGGELGIPLTNMELMYPGETNIPISSLVVDRIYSYDTVDGGAVENAVFRAASPKQEKSYTVVGSIAKNRTLTGSWSKADFFEQSQILLELLYKIRYAAVILSLSCLILGLVLFIFLMMAAGHRGAVLNEAAGSDSRSGETTDSDVRLLMIDRMPMDLAFIITAVICVLLAVYLRSIWNMWQNPKVSFFMLGVCLAGAYIPVIAFCMSFAANVKAGGWRGRTIFGRICKRIGLIFEKLGESISKVGMGGRAWALFALFVGCEFAGLVIFRNFPRLLMACWIIEKAIFFFALLKFLLDFGKIIQVSNKIAEGNLEYKVETDKMLTDFAKVGNSLNTIGDGMAGAVEERMKSERMKTELITNVSHDIKTPLTSIINYTDLLTKLNIEDPTAREYLEVLGRQSARLKKLIEDLIEASKASSGVLKLQMENVNVSMLLMQALGEFEEKFSQKGLDLRITGEQSDLKVMADSRYLWRVFENMMSNMMKYAQPGTRAYIDLVPEDEQVSIIFRNVSEAPLHISGEELMERLVRGDSSRSTEGSGLGLSIADSLVTLMGGTMKIVVDGDLFKAIVKLNMSKEDQQMM